MNDFRIPLAERYVDADGTAYVCYADAVERTDGRFDVRLLFIGGNRSVTTAKPQTTQSNQFDIARWAQGLSQSHIENAFRKASRVGGPNAAPVAVPASTPENIETFIEAAFDPRAEETIPTQVLFDSGNFANADVVRALQRLETAGRIVRFTWQGTDYVSRAAAVPRATFGPETTPSNRPVAPPRLFTMHSTPVAAAGKKFRAYVFGVERADATWAGWIEFRDGGGTVLRTGEETSQPNEAALAYWASGLEALHLEGALQRAR